ncbi:spore maturation protein [Saliterribacillus persicus]|uniref:Spore maturation protein B n=1 Tax=Saliterribacillus persicus TaxID=930114 RepID=A0A368XA93_9BACI|nr:spore maturation protein [Saliterribacillus persicus]RCW64870.1 spore maturation protein B [Saliterribacillus persicus]
MNLISSISLWIIPLIILFILVIALIKKVPAYELFVEGGKEGMQLAISLLPFFLGMFVAISILQSSGALKAATSLLEPILSFLHIPKEIIPLALIRPISGTAALGMTSEIIQSYGPDSFLGRLASTMQGSTDTTFYILTVYFGAVGIKRMGDALKVGLLADIIGIIASIIIVTIVFAN